MIYKADVVALFLARQRPVDFGPTAAFRHTAFSRGQSLLLSYFHCAHQ
jgi:hypothetical protein